MLKRQILLDQADPNGSLPSIAFQKTDSQHTAPLRPSPLTQLMSPYGAFLLSMS